MACLSRSHRERTRWLLPTTCTPLLRLSEPSGTLRTMATEDRKPSRNEVATSVRDELEGRRRFNEHYEIYVPEVWIKSGFGVASSRGGFQAYFTFVLLRVVVTWDQGALAVDQDNDLQDHLDSHWVGRGGTAKLDHEDGRITIDGKYRWESWSKKW